MFPPGLSQKPKAIFAQRRQDAKKELTRQSLGPTKSKNVDLIAAKKRKIHKKG